MLKISKVIVILLVTIVLVVNAKINPKKLFRGRPLDGFVPKPPEEFRAKALASNRIRSEHFTQKLDHFDPSETRTWKQLYQINEETHLPGGPIFVMISGETAADITWMTYGQWFKNARIYHALMFQLEHRFYGTSQPTEDASTANLKYLTSQQALADLDAFIQAMMTKYNINQVVVFGGSYAGNLAAWYQAKYTTALGAIASSAPVTAEVDFKEYLETVGYTMDYFRAGCAEQMQQGIADLQQLVDSNDIDNITSLFNLCPPALNLSDPYDVAAFFDGLINPWMGIVQYTVPDEANSEVAQACHALMNTDFGAEPLQRLSHFYLVDYGSCIPHDYQGEINYLTGYNWNDTSVFYGARQWIWQTCNEFGYYQSTDSPNQPFGQTVPVSYLEDTSCTQVFGQTDAKLNSNTGATNTYYGGISGQEKNTFLPNGSIDPWHNLGIYIVDPDPSDTLGYINGTSHCYDMNDELPSDPPQLTAVRQQITQQIGQWLSNSKKMR